MKKNYNYVAANWWAQKIRSSKKHQQIHGLDLFEKSLALKIRDLANINGSLFISIYNSSSSKLLDETAYYSQLDANIPLGYEMQIILGDIFIYNSKGNLVASF